MNHQGEQLKKAVTDYKSEIHGNKVAGFAKAMGISRQWIYNHFEKPVLEKEIREQAAKVLGIPVDTLFTPVNLTSVNKDADYKDKYIQVLEEHKEFSRALLDSQTMISKTAQAAIEAAASAKAVADSVTSRFVTIEDSIRALSTMTQGIQEFVTVRFAKNENTSRQEVGAALGKAVLDVAKRQKKGTHSVVNT